jgi:hypothetical protein
MAKTGKGLITDKKSNRLAPVAFLYGIERP